MRFFTLLLDPEGRGIPDEVRRSYEAMPRRRGLEFAWRSFDHAAVLTAWDDPYGDPLVEEDGNHLAVGMVRLDNRAELERWAECKGEELTDLGLILRVVARHGTKYIPRILGDFGFVVWGCTTRSAVAACDAFAVRKLYYRERGRVLAFASRAEALAAAERYNVEYLVRLVALDDAPRDLTVYADVRTLPAGSIASFEKGVLSFSRYWSPTELEDGSDGGASEADAVATCRHLLAESIRQRLGGKSETWAQLSGGLDSSTIVSLTQHLAERGDIPHGLAGTVTYVDRQGTGADERRYSEAVAAQWHLRNEVILDAPTWHEDGHLPPRTDLPSFDLQFHPRDRRLCAAVKEARGRVLLTGWGGDEVFMSNMLFFADWLAHGRVGKAVHEMAVRAAIGRVSFWELAYKNAVVPLLPLFMRNHLVREAISIQPWLLRTTLRRYGVTTQSPTASEYAGPRGRKYRYAIAKRLEILSRLTTPGTIADSLDTRHPFMYRPLVEFTLGLHPHMRARPHAHRWVLREAMRGILPEVVRNRIGKQETGEALARSLFAEQGRIAPLLRDPILAQLGVLDANLLRAAFEQAGCNTAGRNYMHDSLHSTLAVEAWLQIRSGRWPHGGHFSNAESQTVSSRAPLRATSQRTL